MNPIATYSTALFLLTLGACNRDSGGSARDDRAERSELAAPDPDEVKQVGGSDLSEAAPDECPVAIEGVEVALTDTSAGIALAFTTSTGDVSELRSRVAQLAENYGASSSGGGLFSWHHAGEVGWPVPLRARELTAEPLPQAVVEVEPLDQGARLIFTPSDPASLEELRRDVQLQHERLQLGECPTSEVQPEPLEE